MLALQKNKNLRLFAAVSMYCFIQSKVKYVNRSPLFYAAILFFFFGIGNFFFSLVGFVVLHYVMSVDFNFSF